MKRTNPQLVTFLDELPHVEAASHTSFATQRETAQQLIHGLQQTRQTIDLVKSTPVTSSSAQDRFVHVMEVSMLDRPYRRRS